MNSLLILSAMTILATTPQSTTDEQEIRQLVKTFEDGWTKKDGNYFAKPFAENADYVVVNGMYLKGREAIASAHQQIFDSFYKETNIKTEVQSVAREALRQRVASSVAVLCGYLNRRSPGVAQTEGPSRLIERLASGVVDRAP